jgi:hypothetical protein
MSYIDLQSCEVHSNQLSIIVELPLRFIRLFSPRRLARLSITCGRLTGRLRARRVSVLAPSSRQILPLSMRQGKLEWVSGRKRRDQGQAVRLRGNASTMTLDLSIYPFPTFIGSSSVRLLTLYPSSLVSLVFTRSRIFPFLISPSPSRTHRGPASHPRLILRGPSYLDAAILLC